MGVTGARTAPSRLLDFDAPESLSSSAVAAADTAYLPHVIAWNLTRRCNLRCSLTSRPGPDAAAAGELDTDACRRVIDELLAVNPSPMLILSGGEPLLRDDLTDIASHASRGGATAVVGTNGTLLTEPRIARLMDAGVTGVAVAAGRARRRTRRRPPEGMPQPL